MDTGINVRKVTSKNLMEYDRLRREKEASWDDIDWEENELESGTGSPDCETHLKIVNSHPVYKELFDLQRRSSDYLSNYDMHLIDGNGRGFVPCHRVMLQQKSEFLDRLIVENLKVNTPGNKNVLSITLMDTSLDHLKTVMTLLYTGSCIVADNAEEDEVKEVLRLLQIDVKRLKFNREPVDPSTLKSKKKKWKTVTAMIYREPTDSLGNGGPTENQSCDGPAANDASKPPASESGRSPAKTTAPSTSGAPSTSSAPSTSGAPSTSRGPSTSGAPSTSAVPQTVRLPTGDSTNSQLPEIRKVPPGTLIQKKPAERIKRIIDAPTPSSSSANRPNEGDSDEEDELSRVPLPVVQKVAPGTLLPLHKQPRIVRNVPAKRGRASRGGRRRGATRRQTNINPEDEDSNGPKGKYEQDHEYIPSGESEAIEEDMEMEVDEEEIQASDENESRPRTRNRSMITAEASTRYPTRKRRVGSSVVSNDAKERESENNRGSEPEQPLPITIDISDSQRGPRTRQKTASPGKKGSTRSSSGNGENDDDLPGHRCTFCGDTFIDIQNLKGHLEETNCAKHLTGTYNILTKYCNTCQTFFKKYSACDFLDHIKVCVCSAKPSQKRRRASAVSAAVTSSGISTSKAPPAQPQNETETRTEAQTETTIKKTVNDMQSNCCEVVGFKGVSILVGRLNVKQISDIQRKVRRGQEINAIRANLPLGHKYVFDSKVETANSRPSTTTKTKNTGLEQPTPRPLDSMTTEQSNATLASVSSGNFNPAFSSTPNSPPTLSTDISKKASGASKKTGHRPGPLSAKRKIAAAKGAAKPDSKNNTNNKIGEVETPQGGLVGQKENDEPETIPENDNVTVPPDNTVPNATTRQPVNTAEKLRNTLRSKLHPSSSKGAIVTDKVISTDKNSEIPNAATTTDDARASENISSGASTEKSQPPPIPASQTTKTTQENAGQCPLPTSSYQQMIQQQRVDKNSTPATETIGSVIETIVEEMIQRPSDINPSTVSTTAVAPTGIATSRDTQLVQRNPSAVTLNSQAPPTQPPPREQITTVSLLNPQMSGIGVQSMASLSAVLGTPARQRMSPLSHTQQSAPRQQTYSSSSASNQLQSVHTQPNLGFPPTSAPRLTQSQQLQLSGQQQQLQMILQAQHSQTHAAQSGVRYDPSVRTTSLVVTSQLQSTQRFQMHQNQPLQMRAAGVVRIAHPNQIGQSQRPSSQPSPTFEGLEIRRVEASRTVPHLSNAGNPGNTITAHSNMNTVALQQHQVHTTPRSSSAPVSITTPYSQLATVNIPNSQIRPTQNQNGPSGGFTVSQQQSLEASRSVTQQQRMTQQEFFQQQSRQQQLQIVSSHSIQSSTIVPQTPVQNTQYTLNTSLQHPPPYNQYQPIPNVIIPGLGGGGGGGQLTHQIANNSGAIATVRLPVTRQMNPLANNRVVQIMAPNTPHQSQMLQIGNVSSLSQTNTSQLMDNRIAAQNTPNLAPAMNISGNITNVASGNANPQLLNQSQNLSTEKAGDVKPVIKFVGPNGKFLTEEKIWKCPDCNLTFKSEDTLKDHQSDGMC